MATRTVIGATQIPEKTTWTFTGVIRDEFGAALGSALLTTLALTLFDEVTGTVINGVTAVNILNNGRGSIDANGNMTITFTAADNAIVTAANTSETHIAMVEWTWASGTKSGKHEIKFTVANFAKVT